MKHREATIAQLKNIGPTIARRLTEVGIHTKADLEAIGPVAAYRRICERHPGKTIPVCYYLYSLEGALRGVHWDAIGAAVKQSLRSRHSGLEKNAAKLIHRSLLDEIRGLEPLAGSMRLLSGHFRGVKEDTAGPQCPWDSEPAR